MQIIRLVTRASFLKRKGGSNAAALVGGLRGRAPSNPGVQGGAPGTKVRVRVKEQIIATPGHVIGQGSGSRPWVVACGGGNSLLTPHQKKLIGAGVSKL